MNDLTFKQKFAQIQRSIKVTKGQKNEYGNYSFRNIEDITEALKSQMADDNDIYFNMQSVPVVIGDRIYIKTIASIIGSNEGEIISSEAYAREDNAQKGMTASQLTGSATSYSRKYAMGALLGLDNTKDDDDNDNTGNRKAAEAKAKQEQIEKLKLIKERKEVYDNTLSVFQLVASEKELDTAAQKALLEEVAKIKSFKDFENMDIKDMRFVRNKLQAMLKQQGE